MKNIYFSKFLRIILLMAIVFFSLGVSGISKAHALCANNDTFDCATAINPPLPFADLSLDTTNYHFESDEPDIGNFAGGCEGDLLRKGLATAWYSYNPGANSTPVF